MKHILVCMKAVPAAAQVQVDGQFRLERDAVSLQWNVADEAALEMALQLRQIDGRVTVLTMGPQKLEQPLRELLGRGADHAVLLTDPLFAGADAHATARALAAAAQRLGGFDLILCGRRAIDGETGQVPGMLAAALNVGCVTNGERLWQQDGVLCLERRLEEGTALMELSRPCVVSVCEYTCPLRLPRLSSLRKARQKRVERLCAADLGLTAEQCGLKGSLTQVIRMSNRFPGLRKGPRETDALAGAQHILQWCREVGL